MQYRTILHSDLNNFYASVECMLNPELKKYPVAVCGKVEERHDIVLAKNYAAKNMGVKTGEAIIQAKCKCPNLVTVEPHYREYIKFSRLVRQIYMEYTDKVEAYGMDENWLDVTGSELVFGSGEKIANEIRERIKFELGLTVSVGVSFNKIFAKLGSDMKKPDAVTCITPDNFREKVWGLPAEDMLGVGHAAGKVLRMYGIHTIGELAQGNDELLALKFGINGARMKRYANGEDYSDVMDSSYHYPIKTIGNGVTFLSDLHSNEEVQPMILALSDRVARRLRQEKMKARGLALMVKCNDLSWKEWQMTLEYPSQNTGEISTRVYEKFRKEYPWVKPLRAMGVRAIRLVDENAPEQISFFHDMESMVKTEAVDKAVDLIRSRFGSNAIKPATTLKLDKMPRFDDEIELTIPTGMLTFA